MRTYLPASGPVRSEADAARLAENWLQTCLHIQYDVGLTKFRDEANGVYFFTCQSREFLETGYKGDMLVGLSYICVDGETGVTDIPFATSDSHDPTYLSKKFRRMIEQGDYA